jgi:hypothetical protein
VTHSSPSQHHRSPSKCRPMADPTGAGPDTTRSAPRHPVTSRTGTTCSPCDTSSGRRSSGMTSSACFWPTPVGTPIEELLRSLHPCHYVMCHMLAYYLLQLCGSGDACRPIEAKYPTTGCRWGYRLHTSCSTHVACWLRPSPSTSCLSTLEQHQQHHVQSTCVVWLSLPLTFANTTNVAGAPAEECRCAYMSPRKNSLHTWQGGTSGCDGGLIQICDGALVCTCRSPGILT